MGGGGVGAKFWLLNCDVCVGAKFLFVNCDVRLVGVIFVALRFLSLCLCLCVCVVCAL